MAVTIKDLPQEYSSCSWHKDEEELKSMLNIAGTKVADGYGCTLIGNKHFLYEKKSRRHIMKAIIQLQDTAERLIDHNQRIDEVFIQCDNIGHHEKSIYHRIKIKGIFYLQDKNVKRIVEIKHKDKSFPIKLYYNKK